ncbi:MAG: glycosyltransferase [Promethearchaeota archaeon]|jgi:lipopolysaccharide biosynthesis glycosyltransferase
MTRGIVYIVGGQKYAKWALQSIISLRRNAGRAKMLPVHVHFIGKVEFEEAFNHLGCTCILHTATSGISHHLHRVFKSLIMQNEVPFDRYVMIDADTFVQGDFYDMFDLIPEDGVAGIEDGNFESHLQMARFLFLTKHADKKNARSIVKELLGIDYGTNETFPPYYNVGVIGFSTHASEIIGAELFPLLEKLSKSKLYNQHDEQLPMNAIMHHKNIHAVAIDPIYNYTRSRMKKNKKEDTHDKIKGNVRIIHNRHYPNEADWIDLRTVKQEMESLVT